MHWYVFNVIDPAGGDNPDDKIWGLIKVRDDSEEHARILCKASLAADIYPKGSLTETYVLELEGIYPPDEEPS